MFTKQHFETVANLLNVNCADLNIVLDFADMFGESNPRFDRRKFVGVSTARLRAQLDTDTRMLAREKGE